MIYKCSNCLFLFENNGFTDRCPDCGSFGIVFAGPEEEQEYHDLRRQFSEIGEEQE